MNEYAMYVFGHYTCMDHKKLKNEILSQLYLADDETVENTFCKLTSSYRDFISIGSKECEEFVSFIDNMIDEYEYYMLIENWADEVGEKYYY